MFRKNSDEVADPEESFDFMKNMVESGEMPQWVTEEMTRLWDNPDSFEEGGTLDEELVDNPNYLMFRLGIVFGIEYERKYPTNGDWRDS